MSRPSSPAPTRLVASLLAACLLVLTGCSSMDGTGDKGYITGSGQVTQRAAAERGAPIDLTGQDLDGRALDVADYRGQVVVLNVWWSGCPPCRQEMPMLVSVAKSSPAQFVGLNIRDLDEAQGQAFTRSFDVPYPSFYDPTGKALLAFDGLLTPRSVPSTVVLDARGRVAASVIGPIPSEATLEGLIEDAGGGRADG